MLAVNYAADGLTPGTTQHIHIYCDCKAAISAVSSTDLHNTHQTLIESIQSKVTQLQTQLNITVHLHWIPGHVNLLPNELADQAAKAAASSPDTKHLSPHLSYSSVKNAARHITYKKWQRAWSLKHGTSKLFALIPQIPKGPYVSTHPKEPESKHIRLVTGHNRLRNHINKLFPLESPCCECSNKRQTLHHVFYECPLVKDQRLQLFDSIEWAYTKHSTPIWERDLTLSAILMPTHSNTATRKSIRDSFMTFIKNINFDI